MSRTALATPNPPEIPSPEDILFTHPPRQVARQVCACGEEYPCTEVRWAQLVKAAAGAAAAPGGTG